MIHDITRFASNLPFFYTFDPFNGELTARKKRRKKEKRVEDRTKIARRRERRAGKKVGALDPPVNKTLGET